MNFPVAQGVIETVSGHFIDLLNPTIEDIDADDIAWGLSRMPRYAAHTVNALIYSVGQHSIFVADTIGKIWQKKEDEIKSSLMSFCDKQSPPERDAILALWNQTEPPKQLLLAGLLHDGAEAYLLDLPTPLKGLPGIKEAYGALERRFMELINEKFGILELPTGAKDIIRWADSYCLSIEAYHLMRSRGKGWSKLTTVTLRGLQEFTLPLPSIQVYENFKAELEHLSS